MLLPVEGNTVYRIARFPGEHVRPQVELLTLVRGRDRFRRAAGVGHPVKTDRRLPTAKDDAVIEPGPTEVIERLTERERLPALHRNLLELLRRSVEIGKPIRRQARRNGA